MLADFTILAENPFDVPTGDIHRIQTRATYLGGKCVHPACKM